MQSQSRSRTRHLGSGGTTKYLVHIATLLALLIHIYKQLYIYYTFILLYSTTLFDYYYTITHLYSTTLLNSTRR